MLPPPVAFLIGEVGSALGLRWVVDSTFGTAAFEDDVGALVCDRWISMRELEAVCCCDNGNSGWTLDCLAWLEEPGKPSVPSWCLLVGRASSWSFISISFTPRFRFFVWSESFWEKVGPESVSSGMLSGAWVPSKSALKRLCGGSSSTLILSVGTTGFPS